MKPDTNPYATPKNVSILPSNPKWDAAICAALWFLLGTAVVYGRVSMMPLYQEFGTLLPRATEVIVSPYTTHAIFLVGAAVFFAIYRSKQSRFRRLLFWLSVAATILAAGFAVFAFRIPLASGIRDLT